MLEVAEPLAADIPTVTPEIIEQQQQPKIEEESPVIEKLENLAESEPVITAEPSSVNASPGKVLKEEVKTEVQVETTNSATNSDQKKKKKNNNKKVRQRNKKKAAAAAMAATGAFLSEEAKNEEEEGEEGEGEEGEDEESAVAT